MKPGEPKTTDGELLEAVKDWRDDTSWQEFHSRYADSIRLHALRSGLRPADAEEVLQETMIKLARALPTFEYDRSVCRFRTWLNQIINQRIVDHHRRRQRRGIASEVSLELLQLDPPDARPPGVDPVEEAEVERAIVEACLAQVRHSARPKHWQIFEAYAIQGLKADEVARLHKVTVSSVRIIRMRLLRQLQAHWREFMDAPFGSESRPAPSA